MSTTRRGPGKKVTLKIPSELYDNLAELIKGTGFRSVSEFAVYVLRDVAAGGKLDEKPPRLSDEEVQLIKQRLRALGYIP
ncbi:MAG: CopG family transcriptional regulator [Planctomycetota bacterium]